MAETGFSATGDDGKHFTLDSTGERLNIYEGTMPIAYWITAIIGGDHHMIINHHTPVQQLALFFDAGDREALQARLTDDWDVVSGVLRGSDLYLTQAEVVPLSYPAGCCMVVLHVTQEALEERAAGV